MNHSKPFIRWITGLPHSIAVWIFSLRNRARRIVHTPHEYRKGKIQNVPSAEVLGGFILPVLLITGVMIILIVAAISSEALNNNNVASHGNYMVDSQMAADAGLDWAMNKMNTTNGWTGSGGDITLLNDTTQNLKTTYNVTVLDGLDSTHKTLSVIANTYSPASSVTPKVTRKYLMDIQAVTSGGLGPSSVVSGVGGLVLSNNAKISGGDVVVNGKINMSNNSQIGLSTNPVNIRVADQVCPQPPDSTYPQVCSGGAQPITTSNNVKIYGNVQANNQTSGSNMYNPGLVAGSVSPITLPVYDRSSFAVSSTHNASDNGIACPNNNGNVTWPANVKILGNIDMGNNCTINITGNVWITGNLTTGNQGHIIVSNAMGATPPVIMIDGSTGFTLANNGKIIPNSSGTGVQMYTFWSNAACSPNCPAVTGPELANSQGVTTINLGNNGDASNSVFIAEWSQVSVSNNGALGAVGGQTISLSNQAVINFTSSVPGSDNRITTWVKRGYMRSYN